jgi:hypothetical protein
MPLPLVPSLSHGAEHARCLHHGVLVCKFD